MLTNHFHIKRNTQSFIAPFYLPQRSSGTGVLEMVAATGVAYTTIDKAWYIREGDSDATAITPATMTVGTWASGGFILVDDTNQPGLYMFGVPNACLAQGAQWCLVGLQWAITDEICDVNLMFHLYRSIAK